MIRKLLVNLGRLLVNSIVEGVARSFEALMEVQSINIRHKTDLNNLPNLGHLPETTVGRVQIESILQVPIH